jgi:transcriptional regulator NrdR family protein
MSRELVCPICEGETGTRVTDTDKYPTCVLRTRICFGCHQPFRTTETIDGHEQKDDAGDGPQSKVVVKSRRKKTTVAANG